MKKSHQIDLNTISKKEFKQKIKKSRVTNLMRPDIFINFNDINLGKIIHFNLQSYHKINPNYSLNIYCILLHRNGNNRS